MCVGFSAHHFLVLLAQFNLVLAYLPNIYSQCSKEVHQVQSDYTHKLMIAQVYRESLFNSSEFNSRGGYPVPYRSTEKLALGRMLQGSDELDRYGYRKAVNHFNGALLIEANNRIITIREEVLTSVKLRSLHRYDRVRHLLGQLQHTLQDFYSNTDWAEKRKDKADGAFVPELGQANQTYQPLNSSHLHLTCADRNDDDHPERGEQGNIVHSPRYVTSGYRSGQDREKPPGQLADGRLYGRCSHGGIYDDLVGGINSESFSYLLSPKHFLHEKSAQSALSGSLYYLNSHEAGLYRELGDVDVVEILGRGSDQHVSFLLTETLQRWAQDYSPQMKGQYLPWEVIHLFTKEGDQVGGRDFLFAPALLTSRPVAVSQTTVLQASLQLPEGSTITIVTSDNTELPELWEADLIAKSLAVREIKLLVLYQTETGNQDAISRWSANCMVTGGHLLLLRRMSDILPLLMEMKPSHSSSEFVKTPDGHTAVPVPANTAIQLMVNCQQALLEEPQVVALDGQIKMGVVLSTDTMAIYTVMSLEGSTALVSVSGSNGGSLSKYGCRATVWYPTSTPMDLYPVISGPHEQLFPSKFGVSGEGKLALEVGEEFSSSMMPSGVVVNGTVAMFDACPFKPYPANSSRQYLSDTLPLKQSGPFTVHASVNKQDVYLRGYLNTQALDISGPYLINSNETASLSLMSRISHANYTIALIHSPDIELDISQPSVSPTADEEYRINITLRSQPSSLTQLQPVILVFTLQDASREEERHSVFNSLLFSPADASRVTAPDTEGERSPPTLPQTSPTSMPSTTRQPVRLVTTESSSSSSSISTTVTSTMVSTTNRRLNSSSSTQSSSSSSSTGSSSSTAIGSSSVSQGSMNPSVEVNLPTGSRFDWLLMVVLLCTLLPALPILLVALAIYYIKYKCRKYDVEKNDPEKVFV